MRESATASSTTSGPDLGRLLGLAGPGAWAVAALYIVTFAVIAISSDGDPMHTLEGQVSLALVAATAITLVLPWRYPLPLPLTAAVLSVVAFTTAAILWNIWPYGWPGYATWNFGADTFLLFMVALRGRLWWGAVGMAAMALITIHWSIATTGDAWHGVDLTYRQIATYLAGAFFAAWLQRTARRIAEYRAAEARRITDEQARESTRDERTRQLARIRELAGPALAQIASGTATTAQRRDHGLLEAELRDQIRGRSLALPELAGAAWDARARGVEVTLLDDLRGDGPSSLDVGALADAAAWGAARLATVADGGATIRLSLVEGRRIVTFATSDGTVLQFSPGVSPADRSDAAADAGRPA